MPNFMMLPRKCAKSVEEKEEEKKWIIDVEKGEREVGKDQEE